MASAVLTLCVHVAAIVNAVELTPRLHAPRLSTVARGAAIQCSALSESAERVATKSSIFAERAVSGDYTAGDVVDWAVTLPGRVAAKLLAVVDSSGSAAKGAVQGLAPDLGTQVSQIPGLPAAVDWSALGVLVDGPLPGLALSLALLAGFLVREEVQSREAYARVEELQEKADSLERQVNQLRSSLQEAEAKAKAGGTLAEVVRKEAIAAKQQLGELNAPVAAVEADRERQLHNLDALFNSTSTGVKVELEAVCAQLHTAQERIRELTVKLTPLEALLARNASEASSISQGLELCIKQASAGVSVQLLSAQKNAQLARAEKLAAEQQRLAAVVERATKRFERQRLLLVERVEAKRQAALDQVGREELASACANADTMTSIERQCKEALELLVGKGP